MVLDRLRNSKGANREEKLLYLIGKNGTDGTLYGRKKLTKLLFFAEHWLPAEDRLSPDELFGSFNFIIYKHGPFSKELFKAFDNLKDDGLLDELRQPRAPTRIRLTEDGQRKLEAIEDALTRDERTQVRAVSENFSEMSGNELEEMSLDYLALEKDEKREYMGMPVSAIISEQS